MSHDHERLSELFLHAAALPPEERDDFLKEECAREPDLLREVESLLRQEQDVPTLLEDGAIADHLRETMPPPGRIGPYHVLKPLGEGGMGVVYLAEQREPIRRRVAVKLVRQGFETDEVLARFASERQVLALLAHPNIARVLDAGATEEGRPYFAMEYVDGEPVTTFCDRQRLCIDERLELFLQACDAVQHAHQNAIIHRDIKPSNILVTRGEGRPLVKVIDFGIAKALAGNGTGAAVTRVGQLVGTEEYMSPEQAGLSPNVDTRSDVYALGALLYELLVGTPPFGARAFRDAGVDERRRIILEEEPLRPSERLTTRGADLAATAEARNTEPVSLRRRCRGDLDWITMRALEKDRRRRYGSASDMAVDLRRHLDHEPVEARPPGTVYRLGKLVRKHRVGAAIVAVAIPLLLGFSVAMGVLAQRLARERDRLAEVSEFLVSLYDVPFFVSGRHFPLEPAEVLAGSAEKVETALADQPLLQARLVHSLGTALRRTGDLERALPLLESSRERLAMIVGADHPRTLAAMNELAEGYADVDRPRAAETLFLEVLSARRRVLGEQHVDTLRTMRDLGSRYKAWERYDAAAPLLRNALEGMDGALGSEHRETLITASLLAAVQLERRELSEARTLLLDTLPMIGEEEPEREMALYNLACTEALLGNRVGALEGLRRAIASGFSIGYRADPNLAPLRGDPEFVEIAKRAEVSQAWVWTDLQGRIKCLLASDRSAEAERLCRYVLDAIPPSRAEIRREFDGLLVNILLRREKHEEALRLAERLVDDRRALLGNNDAYLASSLWYLEQARLGAGDVRGAIEVLDEASAILERTAWGPSRAYLIASRAALLGQADEALAGLREAVEAGFGTLDWIRHDRALRVLRGRPELEVLIDRMSRDHGYP